MNLLSILNMACVAGHSSAAEGEWERQKSHHPQSQSQERFLVKEKTRC